MTDSNLLKINQACAERDFNKLLNICKDTNMNYLGMFVSTILIRQRNGKEVEDDLPKINNLFRDRIIQPQTINVSFDKNRIETSFQDKSSVVLDSLSKLNSQQLFKLKSDMDTQGFSNVYVDGIEYRIEKDMVRFDIEKNVVVEEENHDIDLNLETKVMLLCNWCSSKELADSWNKMSQGDYSWGNLKIIWEGTPDYWVIINRPPEGVEYDASKTIVFQMEPHMAERNMWGEWGNPDDSKFLKIFRHSTDFNNVEWHLGKSYSELSTQPIVKSSDKEFVLSTVLSDKYFDEGHIKRIDFVKYIEEQLPVDVYGQNTFGYKNYKGSLPPRQKDDALLPYKYTFNAENNSISNYFSEKLVDAILSETLCFYWGCPNVDQYIDPSAYIQLPLDDMAKSLEIVKNAIENDEWGKRIETIRREKQKILNQYQFFPRLATFLQTK